MSGFFPEPDDSLKEDLKEDHETEDVPIALYTSPRGWAIHEDMDMISYVTQKHGDIIAEQITDLLAKNKPGTYLKLDHGIMVVVLSVSND